MRTLIKDIVVGDWINIMGWVTSVGDENLIVEDFTGEVFVNYDKSIKISYRDVVCITGKCTLNEFSKYTVENANVKIINKATIDREDINTFLSENLKKTRISILKRENFMKNIVRNYLGIHDFIETAVPLLWKSVKEYGWLEWGIHNPITDKECYKLLQSPNIINLIMAISGVEKSFQFAKCFRLPEENNYDRTDTLVEFHQLGITSTFLNNEEGMNLVEGLMKELVYRLYGKKIDSPFPKYDYNEMNLLYSSDKHDMRFKDCFAPNIKCLKDSNMMLYMFPYDDVNKYVCKYMDKFKNDGISYIVGGIEKIEEKLSDIINLKKELIQIINCDYKKYTYLLVECNKECDKDMCNQIFMLLVKFISKQRNKNIERFNFYWVVNYPYVDKTREGLSGLGQNLFTKRRNSGSYAFDLILNGIEIASGGEKNSDIKEFKQNLKEFALSEDEYEYYIQTLASGAPPMFSVGIGWERVVWKLLETKNMQDTMLIKYDQFGKSDIW